jgi:hypothetical protein
MLRPDPAQRARLVELRDNQDRIAEAHEQRWLGEIEGLTINVAAANDKLADLDKLAARQTTVHLGMPSLDRLVARTIATTMPPDPAAE